MGPHYAPSMQARHLQDAHLVCPGLQTTRDFHGHAQRVGRAPLAAQGDDATHRLPPLRTLSQ